jgi:uncharacterized protein YecT (DUF1311 family)
MTTPTRRIARFALLLATTCWLGGAALAQDRTVEDSYSPTYKTCMDAAGGVTMAMRECGNAEYGRLDAELNEAYRKASEALDPEQRKLLRDTQRAWLAYRDSTCSFMSRLGDRGTMAALTDMSCLMSVTAERTQWLRDLGPI